jgi:hypothetical protein
MTLKLKWWHGLTLMALALFVSMAVHPVVTSLIFLTGAIMLIGCLVAAVVRPRRTPSEANKTC